MRSSRPRSGACRRPARRSRASKRSWTTRSRSRSSPSRSSLFLARRRVVDVAAEAGAAQRDAGGGDRAPRRRSTSPAPPPVDLPPLDQMDGFLRPLLSALSSRPELARWLATDDLVGQLAAAIDQAAAGASPARDFKVIAPASPFVAGGRGERRTIDPASYRRYDGLVQTVTSIDASSVAQDLQDDPPAAERGVSTAWAIPTGDVDRRIATGARHPARHAGREGSDRASSRTAAPAGRMRTMISKSCRRRKSSCCEWARRTSERLLVWLRALQSRARSLIPDA